MRPVIGKVLAATLIVGTAAWAAAGSGQAAGTAKQCLGFTPKQIAKTLPTHTKLHFEDADPAFCRITPVGSNVDAGTGFAIQYSVHATPSLPPSPVGTSQNLPMAAGLSTGLVGIYNTDTNSPEPPSIEAYVNRAATGKRPARSVVIDVYDFSKTAPVLSQDQLVTTGTKLANLLLGKAKPELSAGS